MIIADNKRALFEYKIIDKLEAGIVLTGQEVKSVRSGNINLKGSYISLRNGEFYLIGAHIPPYQVHSNTIHYPERPRKLLLNRKEIVQLIRALKEKGLTLIPLKVYSRGCFIKIEIGLVKGKKRFDKRETIKKRDIDRNLQRSLKH